MLQVTLGADWETIEKSRREIVQKSHPDKVRSLPRKGERRSSTMRAGPTMRSRFCSAYELRKDPHQPVA